MLRTNLSTHPFYNVRAVQVALGLMAAIVIGVTAFNAIEIARLLAAQRQLGATAAMAETEAERLRGQAASIRAQINPRELTTVANQAREANAIIDRRAFSWTELFAQFEATLPPDVRIMSVQPQLDRDGVFSVTIAVQARRVEDLDAFLEALETKSTFRNVLAKQEETNVDGLIEAVVEGVYVTAGRDVQPTESGAMSDALHGMPLLRRVAKEHRRLIVLGALLAVNAVAYGFVVYPLGQRVANSQQRDRAAEEALALARAEHEQATGTLNGKARATTELATFYKDVLPVSLAGARRLTHLRLPQLAREANLRYDRSVYSPVDERESTLHRLKIEMALGGSYDAIRAFIHQLETAPEFVVIDNVSLVEDGDDGGLLTVTLQMSTYYRDEAP